MQKVIFGLLVSSFVFFPQVAQAEDAVQQLRISVNGENVSVTYAKNFATCAHLFNARGQIIHVQNMFCETNGLKTVNLTSTNFAPNLAPAVGAEYKLCHGNNSGICTPLVTAVAECQLADYEAFSALDHQGDGELTAVDILNSYINRQSSAGRPTIPAHARLDLNHDGTYSLAEALAIFNLYNSYTSHARVPVPVLPATRGACKTSHLRAISRVDVAKLGTPVSRNEYLKVEAVLLELASSQRQPVSPSQRSLDFNRDGFVEWSDLEILRNAYSEYTGLPQLRLAAKALTRTPQTVLHVICGRDTSYQVKDVNQAPAANDSRWLTCPAPSQVFTNPLVLGSNQRFIFTRQGSVVRTYPPEAPGTPSVLSVSVSRQESLNLGPDVTNVVPLKTGRTLVIGESCPNFPFCSASPFARLLSESGALVSTVNLGNRDNISNSLALKNGNFVLVHPNATANGRRTACAFLHDGYNGAELGSACFDSTDGDFFRRAGDTSFEVELADGNFLVADRPTYSSSKGGFLIASGVTGAKLGEVHAASSSEKLGSHGFLALANGNFVARSGNASNGGACSLYRATGSLIRLTAAESSNDGICRGGVEVLANGNYVVGSPTLRNGSGGFYFFSGTTGTVVGSVFGVPGERLAERVTPLITGDFVVDSGFTSTPVVHRSLFIDGVNGATLGTYTDQGFGGSGLFTKALKNGNFVLGKVALPPSIPDQVAQVVLVNGQPNTSALARGAIIRTIAAKSFQGVLRITPVNTGFVIADSQADSATLADIGRADLYGNTTGLLSGTAMGLQAEERLGSDLLTTVALGSGGYVTTNGRGHLIVVNPFGRVTRRHVGIDVIEVDALTRGFFTAVVDDSAAHDLSSFRVFLMNNVTGTIMSTTVSPGPGFKLFSNRLNVGFPSSVDSLENGNALIYLTNENQGSSGKTPVIIVGN